MRKSRQFKFTRNEYQFFLEQLYETFFSHANEEDRTMLINEGINNAKDFVEEVKRSKNMESLSLVLAAFVDDVQKVLSPSRAIGKSFDAILEESGFRSKFSPDKKRYLRSICVYLSNAFYQKNDKDVITLGGGSKERNKFKSLLLFWYMGCTDKKDFLSKKNYHGRNDPVPKIVESFSTLFDREDQWEKAFSEWKLAGNWKIAAAESESHLDDSASNFILADEVKDMLHKQSIEYDKRFCYWGDVSVNQVGDSGSFFLMDGKLETNTQVPELDNWHLRGLLSIRRSRGAYYLNLDYEMIPPPEYDTPRTFGYVIFRAPLQGDDTPIFQGYYLSNRMRDPDDRVLNKDVKFRDSHRISMGFAVFYKE